MTPDDDTDRLCVLSVPGGTVGYRIGGTGPLVLLIASTGRSCTELRPIAHALQRHGFRVARPEPRGIEPSRGPMTGIDFHDLARDFAAVIETEGAPNAGAIVAGHAYGTWIARTLASDRPDLVSGVVLLAAGARAWPPHLSDAITIINASETLEEDRRAALRLGFFADGNDPGDWLTGWHPDVVASQRAARAATPQEDWRPTGRAPILDLRGGADPFRPAGTEDELVRELGDRVSARVIEGASHAMPVEKPQAAADAIARWWNGLVPAGAPTRPG